MTECTPCMALRAFTEFVPGYGQVHGDPDSKDNKKPVVPNKAIDKLVGEDKIAKPKGWLTADERKEAEKAAAKAAEEAARQAEIDAQAERDRLAEEDRAAKEKAAQTDYASKGVADLEKLATERGVMPETGTGQNDAVLKADIVAALEAADAKVDYAAKDEAELTTMASELGVMPETGTGENGAVTKDDIVTALEKVDDDSAPA